MQYLFCVISKKMINVIDILNTLLLLNLKPFCYDAANDI